MELLRVLERASYVAITLGNLRKADIASNGIYVGECRRAQRMAAERRMLELPWLNRRSYLRPNPNPGTPVSPPRDLGG